MLLKIFFFAFMAVAVLGDHVPNHLGVVSDLCKKNGAEDKTADAEKAVFDFLVCIKGLDDVNISKNVVEEAKPKGPFDEILAKYCKKTAQLKACISTMLDGISPCLDENSRENLPLIKTSINMLVDLLCSKYHESIAAVLDDQSNVTEDKKSKGVIVELCKKNGAEDKIAQAQRAILAFMICIKRLDDADVTKNEVEDANGSLDGVLDKYCPKTPQLKSCISKLLDGISPCLDENIRENLPLIKTSINLLIDLLCSKHSNRTVPASDD